MKLFKHIKFFFFVLLTFLLGVQTTYAKTELVLPQNQLSFSIEKKQSFKSLEKEVPPNLGFLKENFKFVAVQSVSAQNTCNFSEISCEYLAEAGCDLTTLLLKSGEDFTILTNARKLPGVSIGNGKNISSKWLRGTEGNAGLFPKSVADGLKGQQFSTFDKFREAFWKAVSNDPNLANQFSTANVTRMQNGFAPFVKQSQQLGGQTKYILHHKTPINQGGSVYDMDNLYIVTPKYHKEILDPAYHYGYGY